MIEDVDKLRNLFKEDLDSFWKEYAKIVESKLERIYESVYSVLKMIDEMEEEEEEE